MGCIYFFKLVFLFPLDKYPEVESVDHIDVLFSIFGRTTVLFSIVVAPIYITNNGAQECPFLKSSPALVISCLFDNGHSNRCEVRFHYGSDLHFPYD